jgi:glutathione S-transferase
MIRLIHARSANSLRAAIALELAGLAYERTALDLDRLRGQAPWARAIAYCGLELPAEVAP